MLPVLVTLAVAQSPTRTLAVTPAAEPRPALRYELLPPFRERQPGNAALAYFRAFAARPKPPDDYFAAKEQDDAFEKWLADPLDQLPTDEVRTFLDGRKGVLRELDAAAAADHCDWGILPRLKADGIEALPDLVPSRYAMRLLGLRTRQELAGGRFDDATKSLRAGFRMARGVGESPTYMQLLIGIAFAQMTLTRVEDWIGRPDSPNLFWALTDLPRPLIDPRPGFDGEGEFSEGFNPTLAGLRAGPVPAAEADRIVAGVLADLRRAYAPPDILGMHAAGRTAIDRIGAAGYVDGRLPAARADLLALGRSAAEIDKMPPAQVVFLAPVERADHLWDEYRKFLGVPYHRAWPEVKKLDARVKAEREADGADPLFAACADSFTSAGQYIQAVARLDRRVQFLRVVEAIRVHAAAHGGTPPAKVADVSAVPIPDDPITGKPFGYKVNGTTVVLTGRPPAGEKATEINSFRYEITIRRP